MNGEPATRQRTVREGDVVEIREYHVRPAGDARFLADAHLGGLARFLRMLGFDTLHGPALADEEIRRLAHHDARIVLTRDRELLKCREVARGCYVRSLKAEDQLREVAARYGLAQLAEPFTLCLCCNVRLQERMTSSTACRRASSSCTTPSSAAPGASASKLAAQLGS